MKQNIFNYAFNYACYLKAQLGKEFYPLYFAVGHKFFDVMDYKYTFSLDLWLKG